MSEAVIVSTARTGLGKSYRGSLNNTHSIDLAAHVIKHAVDRAGIDPALVEDVILGATFHEGAQGKNMARLAAIRAGLPVTTAGMSINRFCSSGLQAIAIAAQRIVSEKVPVMVAGGVESISLVQNDKLNTYRATNDWIMEHKPALYMSMIETADIVAKRYGISREAQDEYALISQQRTAAAQRDGKFDDEIVPITTTMMVQDKETGEISYKEVTLDRDECNRPNTTLEGLAKLEPGRGHDAAIGAILRAYKSLPIAESERMLERLRGETGLETPARIDGMWMDWNHIREMADGGMTIGGHTNDHPVLSRLPVERQREEIETCAARIREETGRPMEYFAYPVGSPWAFDDDTVACLEAVGVRRAFSYYGGHAHPGSPRFDTPRMAMERYIELPDLAAMLWAPRLFCRPDPA